MVHRQVCGKTWRLAWPHGVYSKCWGTARTEYPALRATSPWSWENHRDGEPSKGIESRSPPYCSTNNSKAPTPHKGCPVLPFSAPRGALASVLCRAPPSPQDFTVGKVLLTHQQGKRQCPHVQTHCQFRASTMMLWPREGAREVFRSDCSSIAKNTS